MKGALMKISSEMKKIVIIIVIISVVLLITAIATLSSVLLLNKNGNNAPDENSAPGDTASAPEEWSEGEDRTRLDAFFAENRGESYYRVMDITKSIPLSSARQISA